MRYDGPLVSVYIPTRNRVELLTRAVRSVLRQDYGPIEILVVDDSSEDGTGQRVAELAAECMPGKHVVYFRQPAPAGASAARNRALAAAQGELVTGLDDDDHFLSDRVSRLVAAFDPARCSFVFDGYVRETHLAGGRTRRTAIHLDRPARLLALLKRNIVGNQVLTLTSRLRDVGGFDERLPAWQDYDLWIRMVKAFGEGKPAGGISYVHAVDDSLPRISGDTEKVSRAFDLFLEKHVEYADRELSLCLRLAKTVYGIDALTFEDAMDLLKLGEPRYVLFALYSYLVNRRSRKIVR
ncbi:MAG: glycosyltransferase [Sulfuritalea sp.]|nr:glycosyltransferase [Sulfuritalea sp.]